MVALFTALFLVMLTLTTALRVWLNLRQRRHVLAHRDTVPPAFADRITPADHQKAASYTVAKLRVDLFEMAADTLLLLAFTIGGLLASFDAFWRARLPDSPYLYGLALFASVGLTTFIAGLPFTLWRIFGIEAKFGFNRTTPRLFVIDLMKQFVLILLIGVPLLLAVLWLMGSMGRHWWLYVWLTWIVFNLLVLLIYPTFIAPLFNEFTPLAEGEIKRRIEALLERCGFASSGVFVMDGSKRSTHGNAYFTGFGKAKRIVFFDTLLDKLAPDEIEAVLAHELGHHRRHHIAKRIAVMSVISLAVLWLLGQLIDQPWFYAGLNVADAMKVGADGTAPNTALALILFSLVLPVFAFPLTPSLSWLSRRHEFEADAFAAEQSDAKALIAALVKLYRDNAATLTPDPLHSLFYDSHPPASERIARLASLSRQELTPC
ncbi:MAG: M48 family metallopeptidase [Rhodocyclaceae bacterium]